MDDLISRQAAISAICNACGKIDCDKMDKCEKLQLSPANISETPNSSDVISRQQAIEALNSRKTAEQCEAGKTRNWTVDICVDMIKQLPPIQPEIVRCEECLYRKICSWEKQGAKFCSFAERREATE